MPIQALPVRYIRIDDADLEEIKRHAWNKTFKSAELAGDGQSDKVEFGLRGGHTRNYLKKSFEVRYANGKTLHWNAEFDDPSLMRNALSFQFFNLMGVPAPETQHFWLVINGVDQGVYLEIESVDRRFFEKRGIPYRSLIYAVNDSAEFSLIDPLKNGKKESLFDGYELKSGGSAAQKRLVTFIRQLNLNKGQSLRSFTAKRLDIQQYLHWLAGAVLTGNYDGFDQNYALYEHKTNGKYRIIPWDYEGTWGRNCYGKPCGSDLVRLQGYNRLTNRLFSFAVYRQKYSEIMRKQLQSNFTTQKLDPIIDEMHEELAPAIRFDYTRKSSYDTFLAERDFIKQYIIERRQLIEAALQKWNS